jgi:hypothetical protein
MKTLLVEGIDDQKVIEKLLKRRKIEFADFTITNGEGLDKLLKNLPTIIRTENYEIIGILVDADENITERWERLQRILRQEGYHNIPPEPAPKGTLLKDGDDELPRVGIWLMPDNQLKVTIEDFIRVLVPDKDDLMPFAEQTVDHLIAKGKNRFKVSQRSKALIHTWLAWQARPGKQLGSAITYRVSTGQKEEYLLDDRQASDFIEWLKKLFE